MASDDLTRVSEMEAVNYGRKRFPAADRGSGAVLDGRSRRWEDLSSDLLLAIFSRIGVADLIAGVPYVCSAWRYAARDPFCWRVLDFRSWGDISHRLDCRRDEAVDFADLFDFAITRSEEVIDSVYFPYFSDEIDLECPMLQYFSMKNPNVSEAEFCKAIGKIEFLKGMAVDESLICHQVLQHVSQCCVNFIELKVFSDTMDETMASIICECLPRLQKLEITECVMSRGAILTLLDGLKELEYLDVSGYEISGITSEVIKKAARLKVFRWDSKYDLGGFEYCHHCEEDYSYQAPCECMLDQQLLEWLANLS
ncbi:F-box/LRR-repeat protein At3g48880-like isoform X3 [Phalaenopsis equestris]|uniref:F-box/LRR-repeat protein At3g48880-like isoform X3 n=1 Tax=Phalaenopsis equestris TaxID=78828 RepID=UPI0009E29881|nr:F-box/LRR-repeat protein At3g48880-like isoform X3 [Phalaenopsis equestris]